MKAEFKVGEKVYRVRFTIGVAREIEERFGLDLMDFEAVQKAINKPGFFVCDLAYLALSDREISAADFGESLDGKAIEDLGTAVLEAMINFTQSQPMRQAMKRSLTEMLEVKEMMTEMVETLDYSAAPKG